MTPESKDHGAFLRSLARESYEELVDFATQQMRQQKGKDDDASRTAAITLVSEITSEVAAETAAEAAAQIAAEVRSHNASGS